MRAYKLSYPNGLNFHKYFWVTHPGLLTIYEYFFQAMANNTGPTNMSFFVNEAYQFHNIKNAGV